MSKRFDDRPGFEPFGGQMKFTDGYWRMRDGVHAVYPVQALDVTAERDGLTAYVTARAVHDRGDLLDGPLFTYRAHAPMPGVIGVTLTHFAGKAARGPDFTLYPEDGYAPTATAGDGVAELSAGPLTLRFTHDSGWRMELLGDGRPLTGTGARSTAFIETPDGRHHVREQLDLGVGRHAYGLGERFGSLVRNGQTVDMWNADGGTTSELAYKNVPFLLTDAGYGIFVDHPRPGLLRGGVGGGVPAAVQRRGPVADLLRRVRPHAQGDPGPLHRADRPARAAARLVVRAVAVHLVHHLLRRGDRRLFCRRHGGAGPAAVGLPLRLLLDARVQLV